jgi:hypothetical protein
MPRRRLGRGISMTETSVLDPVPAPQLREK